MKVFRGIPAVASPQRTAVAIGNFDGVHLGHQVLLNDVRERARALGGGALAAALTFEPHPREFFCQGSAPARITPLRDKAHFIARCGIDRLFFAHFDKQLASLSPEEFVREILVGRLRAAYVSVGGNFTFGRFGKGRAPDLVRLGREAGIEVNISPLLDSGKACISSSRIRELLSEGRLAEAERLMGHPCTITGRVLHGAQLGRTIGFPTLNVRPLPPGCKARPALEGVFTVRIEGLEPDRALYGVCSMGNRPTVGQGLAYTCETNVFDWKGDAYGRMIRIVFLEKLRGNKRFSSLAELQAAIASDARRARDTVSALQAARDPE